MPFLSNLFRRSARLINVEKTSTLDDNDFEVGPIDGRYDEKTMQKIINRLEHSPSFKLRTTPETRSMSSDSIVGLNDEDNIDEDATELLDVIMVEKMPALSQVNVFTIKDNASKAHLLDVTDIKAYLEDSPHFSIPEDGAKIRQRLEAASSTFTMPTPAQNLAKQQSTIGAEHISIERIQPMSKEQVAMLGQKASVKQSTSAAYSAAELAKLSTFFTLDNQVISSVQDQENVPMITVR